VFRALPEDITVRCTLSWKGLKLPFRLLGRYRTLQLHDWLTARWLDSHAKEFDLVHCWPAASLRTIRVARRHGIPCLLERPNAHTAYAFESSDEETQRLGIQLPANHDHASNQALLAHEQQEYAECDFLLSPSDFVAKTFIERGTNPAKILSHHYGFDEKKFHPDTRRQSTHGLQVLYAGACEPRKGLHYALEAWTKSEASKNGQFQICGSFVPGYAELLKPLLSHPTVKMLGQRDDIASIMRKSDILVLSSIEEGSALVTYEAMASGCVLLVSEASGAHCENEFDALIHPLRAVETLRDHFNQMHHDRDQLALFRQRSLARSENLTWKDAGRKLLKCYQEAMVRKVSVSN
jgi:glycosyltransferase involved in cell wall biosynthesis